MISPRRAFALGFAAGFAFWIVTVHWLWYVTVAGWIALAAYCALYVAGFAWFCNRWLAWAGGASWARNLGFVALAVDVAALHWLAAPLICSLPVLLIVVAEGPRHRPWGLWVLWAVLTASWLGLLWLSSTRDWEQPSPEDIGRVLALMLVGLGLTPMALMAWLYARGFLSRGLRPDDLRQLRETRKR